MFRVRLRIRRDIDYRHLSERHPGSTFHVWCNFHREVVETVSPSEEAAVALREDLRGVIGGPFTHESHGPEAGTQLFGMACRNHRPGNSVTERIERHGAIRAPPLLFKDGWEYLSMTVIEEDALGKIMDGLKTLGAVEVLGKTRLRSPFISRSYFVAIEELLSDLTPKQAEAFSRAMERGYYDLPRRATMKDIADATGTPRTTLEQHVRKAEKKLLGSVAPYVRIIHGTLD